VEIEQGDGAGQFESVTLRPHAKLAAGSDENIARRLHDAAAEKCFIARSVVQVRARTDVRHCVGVGEHPPLTDAVSTEAKNRVNRLKLIIASDLEYLFPTHIGHECVCGIRNSVARQIFWHGPEYSTGAPMRTWKSKS